MWTRHGILTETMSSILILDDRKTNQRIYARLAADLDDQADVTVFSDPLQALGWLEENAADLVVTDYKMPQMDGAEFTRLLRNRPTNADVPVVVITAYEDRSFRMRALEAGATDFLQSPIDPGEFVVRARNLLAMHRQQKASRAQADVLNQELAVQNESLQLLVQHGDAALAQVIDTVPCMLSAADRQGRCVFVNAMQARIAGAPPGRLVGAGVAAVFGAEQAERSLALDRVVFESGRPLSGYEEEYAAPDGVRRVLLTTKTPLRGSDGAVTSVLTTSLDVTEQKFAEARLRHMAQHDTLTDLPNRSLLTERLRREMARGRRGTRSFALHLLDLDRFQYVNDAHGHPLGDRLLREVARRLRGIARADDMVARLGGDEFAVLQTDVAGNEDAVAFACRALNALAAPCRIGGREIEVSASIGIAMHPRDGRDGEELLRNADLALYRAKEDGGCYHFYAADMDRHAREAVHLEADLRAALGRQEFLLHYQPQMNLRSRRILGVEALLRWQRPGFGLLRPGEFLAVAEATGLILPINVWVLQEACRQAARWQAAGMPLRMSVNLSPIQFRKQDLLALVQEALAITGLDPLLLDLELTEGMLMENADRSAATLRELRQLGVGTSIDDFGTGYSALNYVKHFPVDRIKIDQSFVRNVTEDPSDAAIVRAVVNMGHSLKLQVTAEGVETAAQLAHLCAEDCDEVQGDHLSPPVPAAEIPALLQRRHRA